MGYYEFPHTRNYDQDLGFLIKKYLTLENNYLLLENKYDATNKYLKELNDNIDKQIEVQTKNQLDNLINDGTIEEIVNSTTLLKKKILLIGDSYGQGYTPDGNVTSWTERSKFYLEKYNCEVTTFSQGRLGMGTTPSFNDFLISNLNSIPDKKYFTHVLIGGGYNDNSLDSSAIEQGLNDLLITIRQNFPKAIPIIACIGARHSSNTIENAIINKVRYIYSKSYRYNGVYLDGVNILHERRFFSSDGFHPNEQGQLELATFITNFLLTGNLWKLNVPYANATTTDTTSIGTTTYSYGMSNDIVTLQPLVCTLKEATNLSGGSVYQIGDLDTIIRYGFRTTTSVSGTARFTRVNGDIYVAPVTLYIDLNGKLCVTHYLEKSDHTGFIVIGNVEKIEFNNFCMILNASNC